MLALGADVRSYGACETHAVITEVTLLRCDHRHHLPLPSSADRERWRKGWNMEIKKRERLEQMGNTMRTV